MLSLIAELLRSLADSTTGLPDLPLWAQLGIAAPAYVACYLLWKANSKTLALKDSEIAELNVTMVKRTDEQAARERELIRTLGTVVERSASAIEAVPHRLRQERDLSQDEKSRVRSLVTELTDLIDRQQGTS